MRWTSELGIKTPEFISATNSFCSLEKVCKPVSASISKMRSAPELRQWWTSVLVFFFFFNEN